MCADGTAARREGVERLTSRQSDEEDSGHTAPNSSQWPNTFIDAVTFSSAAVARERGKGGGVQKKKISSLFDESIPRGPAVQKRHATKKAIQNPRTGGLQLNQQTK